MWLRLARMSGTMPELARGLNKLKTVRTPVKDGNGKVLYYDVAPAGKIAIDNQIKIYANGTPTFYQIADEALVNFNIAINDLGGAGMTKGLADSIFYKPLQASAAFFTIMTTGIYPYWFISNLTVDQLSAALNSRNGTIFILSSAKHFLPAFGAALGTTIRKQATALGVLQKMFPNQNINSQQVSLMMEYMGAGGAGTTMMADMLSTDQREELRRLFDIEPKGLIPKAKYYAKKKVPESIEWTMDFLSTPTNLTELITRFTEYSIARKQGMSVEAAMRHSIETMPFIKRGASRFTRTYFPLVSYLKASYVVGFKSLQELSAKEQRAKWTFVWSGVATAAALALLNMWEDLTESEKNYHRQRDASELAQYVHIPGRFLGDERPDSPIYKFRIPEYIGSAQALGMMYAMSISDSTEINKVDLAYIIPKACALPMYSGTLNLYIGLSGLSSPNKRPGRCMY